VSGTPGARATIGRRRNGGFDPPLGRLVSGPEAVEIERKLAVVLDGEEDDLIA